MATVRRIAFAWLVLTFLSHPAAAQAPKPAKKPADKKAKVKKVARRVARRKEGEAEYARLPAPFDDITGNAQDFEGKDKLLKIIGVRYDFAPTGGGKAIIWKMKANRDMTFRRLKTHMRSFREARFYYKSKTDRLLLKFQGQLSYPTLVDAGAGNNERMLRNQEFDLWIPLSDAERRKVLALESNHLVFTRRATKR